MINKELLRQIIIQQQNQNKITEKTVQREVLNEILKNFKDNRILILTGLRRSGKSTLLNQIMATKKDWCYVNFEDERFIEFQAQNFEMLNEVLIEIYGNPKIYFFDEIQNIEKFETFTRRLQDQGKKIIITGSNATLLSKELGTRLTGRYKSFEVYPFSFKEYLTFKEQIINKEKVYLAETKVQLLKLFKEYLLNGGMPEYLKNKDPEYIKTVYNNILYRDIIARYGIRQQRTLKELATILATNISLTITYNSLKKDLKLANSITVKEYLSYLSNTYLFFEMQKFDYSIRKQLSAPKKIYLIDSSFNKALGTNFTNNQVRLLENTIFLELKRKNKEINYYSSKKECDFVIKQGKQIKEAIQVCYELTQKNKERENQGLIEAMNAFKLKEGFIITYEQEEELKEDGKQIRIIPAWKWLLKEE